MVASNGCTSGFSVVAGQGGSGAGYGEKKISGAVKQGKNEREGVRCGWTVWVNSCPWPIIGYFLIND